MTTLHAYNLPLDGCYLGPIRFKATSHTAAVDHIKTLIQMPELRQEHAIVHCEEHGDTEIIFWLDNVYDSGDDSNSNESARKLAAALATKSTALTAPLYGNCVVTAIDPDSRTVASLPAHTMEKIVSIAIGRCTQA